jgi:hypothetical protein
MDKYLKIVLGLVTALLLINFLYTVFALGKPLNKALEHLEVSSRKIDTALFHIDAAKVRLDSLKASSESFKEFTEYIAKKKSSLDAVNDQEASTYQKKLQVQEKELTNLAAQIAKLKSTPPLKIPITRL